MTALADHKDAPPADFEAAVAGLLAEGRLSAACEHIVMHLGPGVRGYLRAVLGSQSDGDDVYQEVCAAVCAELPGFAGRSSVRTWVYAIAHHLFIKQLRRYSRGHKQRLGTSEAQRLPQPGVTSVLLHEQRRQAVRQVLSRLAPQERELIVLRIERRLAFRDIAGVLGLGEDAARQRFQRAKERLKELVAEMGVE